MTQVRSPPSGLKDSTLYPAFFIAPAMNPLTVCRNQPIFSMISASVAPFLRWSIVTTCSVLLPSRGPAVSCTLAVFLPLVAFLAAVAFLPFFGLASGLLACCGAVVASSVAPPSRFWIAFQIPLTADFRSVNFLTGVRPGIPFQTSISRLAGHLVARSASSCWLPNISPSKSACWLPRALMLFSASIVNVVILLLLTAAAVMAFITPKPGTNKSILRILKKNPRRGIRRTSWRSGSSLQLAAHRPGSNRRQPPGTPHFYDLVPYSAPLGESSQANESASQTVFMARRGLPGL